MLKGSLRGGAPAKCRARCKMQGSRLTSGRGPSAEVYSLQQKRDMVGIAQYMHLIRMQEGVESAPEF
jgi:hypothetical protein